MKKISLNNSEVEEVKLFLGTQQLPSRLLNNNEKRPFRRRCSKFVVENDVFWFKKTPGQKLRFFTTEQQLQKEEYILLQHYSSGHPGRNRLMGFLSDRLYNFSRGDTMSALARYVECDTRRVMATRPPIIPIDAMFPIERLIVDLVDLRSYSNINLGFSWLFVAVDSFSKYAWTFKLENKRGETIADCLLEIFEKFGAPLILHTDNGLEFVNRNIVELKEEYNFYHIRGRVRCPWMQGQVERLNQTLKYSISACCNQIGIAFQWIRVYRSVTACYNNFIHETTRQTPMRLLFGPDPLDAAANMYDDPTLENFNETFSLWDREDGVLIPEEGVFENWNYIEADQIREHAIVFRHISMDRMVRYSQYRNDVPVLNEGDRVVRKVYTDNNPRTRARGLNEHYDFHTYIVQEVSDAGVVYMVRESDDEVFTNVSIRYLRRVEN